MNHRGWEGFGGRFRFPAAGAHPVLRVIMAVNPMTYGVAALRHALFGAPPAGPDAPPSLLLSVTVCVLFGAATFALAMRFARRATAGDLA